MMVTMSVLDTRYVQVGVDTTFNGVVFNPTGDATAMAFMPSPPDANPGVSDWKTGSWVTLPGGKYAIRCLVGPANGGNALATGNYKIWTRIIDNPEIPIQEVGILQIV